MTNPTSHAMIIQTIGSVISEVDPRVGPVSEAMFLLGQDAVLDSVGLVSVLIGIEQALHGKLDLSSLFIEHGSLGGEDNPFRTVGSLANLISRSTQV